MTKRKNKDDIYSLFINSFLKYFLSMHLQLKKCIKGKKRFVMIDIDDDNDNQSS